MGIHQCPRAPVLCGSGISSTQGSLPCGRTLYIALEKSIESLLKRSEWFLDRPGRWLQSISKLVPHIHRLGRSIWWADSRRPQSRPNLRFREHLRIFKSDRFVGQYEAQGRRREIRSWHQEWQNQVPSHLPTMLSWPTCCTAEPSGEFFMERTLWCWLNRGNVHKILRNYFTHTKWFLSSQNNHTE